MDNSVDNGGRWGEGRAGEIGSLIYNTLVSYRKSCNPHTFSGRYCLMCVHSAHCAWPTFSVSEQDNLFLFSDQNLIVELLHLDLCKSVCSEY